MRRLATVSVGRSPRRLKVACQGDGQHVNGKAVLPSSIFLISTERSATSLSTTNCSLSEVTRRTIVDVDGRCRCRQREGGQGHSALHYRPLSHPLTGHCDHGPINVLFIVFTLFRLGLFALFCPRLIPLSFRYFIISCLPGSIRTATKRAGGSVRNHGGSPGKRLGVKKFSGVYHSTFVSIGDALSLSRPHRPIRDTREHHRASAWNAVSPWSACASFSHHSPPDFE